MNRLQWNRNLKNIRAYQQTNRADNFHATHLFNIQYLLSKILSISYRYYLVVIRVCIVFVEFLSIPRIYIVCFPITIYLSLSNWLDCFISAVSASLARKWLIRSNFPHEYYDKILVTTPTCFQNANYLWEIAIQCVCWCYVFVFFLWIVCFDWMYFC